MAIFKNGDMWSVYNDPSIKVALNFPGIGCGGLNRSEVLPIMELLPDNVEIWEYASTSKV